MPRQSRTKKAQANPEEPVTAEARHRRKRAPSFPIIGIGASAGGLEAFTQLLSRLPRKSGMAFVLVQHLSPKYESALSSLLGHATQIPVAEVKDKMPVERDHVYVIPPNVVMGLVDGHLHLMPRKPTQRYLPIDFFFNSLAEECGNKAIGVILSGTASDGTNGMKAIKAEGGITFAQNPETAKYSDMPSNAIASGCVDFVLDPADIAKELTRLASHPYVRQPVSPKSMELAPEGDEHLTKIFALLRSVTGVDFSHYKRSTINRRLKRRMVLQKSEALKEYAKRLQEDRQEVEALYQDILIHVTGFFRDESAFEALKKTVFPALLDKRPAATPIRIWVPGCSSGEEVYSLAICLLEHLGDAAKAAEIQIFGTDISDPSLDRARAGAYPDAIASEVNPERLRHFFTKSGHGYRINKFIRDVCVFARQNVNRDPPFSRLDLISCRNLLIYLDGSLQKKILPIFHYALRPNGFLLLGGSETIGGFSDLFKVVDKKNKIYTRIGGAPRRPADFTRLTAKHERPEPEAPAAGIRYDVHKEADRVLLSRYAPAGVLITDEMQILQFRGRTGNYLEPASGQPTLSLTSMAREGLLPDLRELVHKAKQDDVPVKKEGVPVRRDSHMVQVNIEVIPIRRADSHERHFLVMFEDVRTPKPAGKRSDYEKALRSAAGKRDRAHENRAAGLRDELAETRSTLQTIIEEQETTNEELKAANEEVLSSNEELQSTNEELETAKEELQSSNEELNTVNEELQNRNLELSTANNDLLNILANINIPMLILGNDLRVRHFTSPAEKLFNLIPSDVGRPIGHLKPNLIFNNLERTITDAIDDLEVKEFEIQDNQGAWYIMRIRPYKTSDNKLDGAVITWNDITSLKTTLESRERALSHTAQRYHLIFEGNLAGIFRMSLPGRLLECNSAFAQMLGYDSEAEALRASGDDLFGSRERFREVIDALQGQSQPISRELKLRHRSGQPVWVLLKAFLLPSQTDTESEIEGILLDISARKQAEQSLRQYSTWLLQSQEAERKRISQDLHSTTGSNLAGLIAQLGLALKGNRSMEKEARSILRECLKLAKQCAKEIRTVSYLLHPPLLDEAGLPSALRWYVEGFAQRSGVKVQLEVPSNLGRLSRDLETALFRIVQECLANIQMHSGSSTAHIRVTDPDQHILLEVSDNGKGFHGDVAGGPQASEVKFRPGVGILSMRERAAQLGGKLEISSGKNGTTITATFPTPTPPDD